MDPAPLLLVILLGAPSFEIREAAERSLARRGVTVWLALDLGTHAKDAEVRFRCDRLLDEGRTAYWSSWPYLDSLPLDWPDRSNVIERWRDRSLEHPMPRDGCPDFPVCRDSGRLFLLDMIRAGRLGEAAAVASRMRERMKCWNHQRCRYTDDPGPSHDPDPDVPR